MSLFGGGQQASSGSLFGSSTQTNQQKPSNPFASFGSSQPAQQSGLFTAASSTSQAQPSGGLFGSTTNTQPQQSGGLFGSSTTTQPQQQSGGLFGSSNTTQTQQQSGGLFGSSTATQPQQSGGLFGSSTTTQPQQSGGLFGATVTQTPQSGGLFGSTQQPKPQQSGGLFGAAQQPQTSQGSSLFGGLGQSQNQTQQQSGGLFGGTTSQSKPTLSLFGANSNTQNQQQQQPSLFSNSSFGPASANMPKLGTSVAQQPQQSLTMGQPGAQNQQQTVPGVNIDVSNLRGTTRFNDLYEELQKQIEQIDSFIQQQIAYKEQCDALMPAHEQNLLTIPSNVDFVKTVLETTETALENDSAAINTMKTIIQKDAENARIGFRAVENLKLPQQFHYSGIWHSSTSGLTPPRGSSANRSSSPSSGTEPTDLVSYFNAQASELSKTLDTYKRNISEIETHLGAVEASVFAQSQQLMFRKGRDGGTRSKSDQVEELSRVLREFENSILGVAGRFGQVREAVVDVMEAGQGGVFAGRR